MGILDLTTVLKFKSWYDFKGNNADDALIADLIAQRSMDILAYLGRKTVLKTTYTEYYNGTGTGRLMLRQWPVIEVNSMTIDGVTVASATPPNTGFFIPPFDGFPPGSPGVIALNGSGFGGAYPVPGFCAGSNNVYISYVAGYAVEDEARTIPAAPYAITAAQPYGMWARDDGVTNAATGNPLTVTTGTPATGQYTVNDGVYTFAAADTGVAVLLNYSYVPFTLESACREAVGERYSYRQHIGQTSQSMMGQTTTSYDNKGLTDFVKKMIHPFKMMVPN